MEDDPRRRSFPVIEFPFGNNDLVPLYALHGPAKGTFQLLRGFGCFRDDYLELAALQCTATEVIGLGQVCNLAAVYKLQKNYLKALDFNKQALQLSGTLGRRDGIAASLQNMGKTFLLMKDTLKARNYFQEGLGISEKEGSILGMAVAWSNISLTCGNDYEAILRARTKARQLWDETNPVHPEAIANLGNLGICYLDIARGNTL